MVKWLIVKSGWGFHKGLSVAPAAMAGNLFFFKERLSIHNELCISQAKLSDFSLMSKSFYSKSLYPSAPRKWSHIMTFSLQNPVVLCDDAIKWHLMTQVCILGGRGMPHTSILNCASVWERGWCDPHFRGTAAVLVPVLSLLEFQV